MLRTISAIEISVPIYKKHPMLLAMKTVDGDEDPAKRIEIDSKTLHEKDLHRFTTQNTKLLINGNPMKVLYESRVTVQALSVVNDYAEIHSISFWIENV